MISSVIACRIKHRLGIKHRQRSPDFINKCKSLNIILNKINIAGFTICNPYYMSIFTNNIMNVSSFSNFNIYNIQTLIFKEFQIIISYNY